MSHYVVQGCAALIVALLAGCGGQQCPGPVEASAKDAVLARALQYEESLCACTKLPCVATAEREMAAWTAGNKQELEAAFADPLRSAHLSAISDRVATCKQPLAASATDDERAAAYPDEHGVEKAIAAMGRIADDFCQCRDQACADAAMKQMARLEEPTSKPSKEAMERAMKIAERMAECQKRIMMDVPPPPP